FAYAIGTPVPAVNPDTLDQQEWQQYQEKPVTAGALMGILNTLPHDTGCGLVRHVWPCAASNIVQPLLDGLEAQRKRAAGKKKRSLAAAGHQPSADAGGDPAVGQRMTASQT